MLIHHIIQSELGNLKHNSPVRSSSHGFLQIPYQIPVEGHRETLRRRALDPVEGADDCAGFGAAGLAAGDADHHLGAA